MRAPAGNCCCSQLLPLLSLYLSPGSPPSLSFSLSHSLSSLQPHPSLFPPTPHGRSIPPLYQPPRVLLGPTLTPAYGVRTAGVSLRAPSVNFSPGSPAYVSPLLAKKIIGAFGALYTIRVRAPSSFSHLFRKLQTIPEYGTPPC